MSKNEHNKRTTIVKEKDMIKDTDLEDEKGNTKRILIVVLILALLIGGFAFVRSLDSKEKTPVVDNDEEEKPPVNNDDKDNNETNQTDNQNAYVQQQTVVNTPKEPEKVPEKPKVNIWQKLDNILTEVEAGSIYELPTITVDDKGETVTAEVSYYYKADDDSYVELSEFDTNIVGEYRIVYTVNYSDGTKDSKEVTITIVDTTAPIINDLQEGSYYNDDITLNITEYTPYVVFVNDEEYDPTVPITEDGIYTIEVVEDRELGMGTIITVILDKTAPVIEGVEENGYYNEAVVVDVKDCNLDTSLITKDDIELPFTNGVTEFEEEGTYKVVATDKAGNITEYTFTLDFTLPEVNVEYTPGNEKLTTESVIVKISANEPLQEVEDWILSEDKLSLTKEFTKNDAMTVEVKDLAGNSVDVEVIVNYIVYEITYTPKLTIENLVANRVKATITSLIPLELDDEGWTLVTENLEEEDNNNVKNPTEVGNTEGTTDPEIVDEPKETLYVYEKIYDTNGTYEVNYTDEEGNTGTIEIAIEIELNDLFVTYEQSEDKSQVTAYVVTDEEVAEIPEGWTEDLEYTEEGFRYYKIYTENVEYEVVEFVTESKYYVATIIIDTFEVEGNQENLGSTEPKLDEVGQQPGPSESNSTDPSDEIQESKDALAVSSVDVSYDYDEFGVKTSATVTISFNHEMLANYAGWSLLEDNKTLTTTILKPELEIPEGDQTVTLMVSDVDGNEIEVDYTYNWN